MSGPKLISPLLDGFIMGEPISDHDGVRCCPALREDTDERYMVKIISIPATQDQLAALLLSGAFQDEQKALIYFKDLAKGIDTEAASLSRLSKLEGFLPYQSSQTIKMDDGVGYDVYLLAPYRRSLHKQMRSDPLTHIAAVNLGLDMCAALAVCRRAGYLYADLKPENIFLTETRGYCIGDLGMISLSSLKYASLPQKYRSSYTAPEITDAYDALTDTLDIYALGLVLYQVFNNGQLPFEGTAPARSFPPPLYADYEMAAIILKACAPDPKDRWRDPAQMGQALVDYLQRNDVNDTPIVPPPVEPVTLPEEEEDPFLTEEENDQELAELLAMIPDEEPPVSQEPDDHDPSEDASPAQQETVPDAEDGAPIEAEPNGTPLPSERSDPSTEEPALTDDTPAEGAPTDDFSQEAPADDISVEDAPTDETSDGEENNDGSALAPEEVTAPEQDDPTADTGQPPPQKDTRDERTEDGLTTEVAQMLAQADELLLVQLPEPVVAPDPIDVPIPPPIVPEPDPVEEVAEEGIPNSEQVSAEEVPTPQEDGPDGPAPEEVQPEVNEETFQSSDPSTEDAPQPLPKKRKKGGLIALGIVLVVLALLAFGAYHYYHDVYLQTIDSLTIDGEEDQITVSIDSDIDEDLLTVVCTDTYGNTFRSPVTDGSAVFTSLTPNTRYQIHLEVSGFHSLQGQITGSYTTATQTEILNFHATTGADDGTVILSFTVSGPGCDSWIVEYSANGVEPKSINFTGTHVTIGGLTVGETYTFHLLPTADLYITGTDQIQVTPQKVVRAENITVASCGDGSMTLVWDTAEGTKADRWLVRCFNDTGYDQDVTTTENRVTFEGLDHSTGYTVIITAEGMARSEEITITADPINITGYTTEQTTPWTLDLSWAFTGQVPANGWILSYTIDDADPIAVMCPTNEAIIALHPGCSYTFHVRPADDITFFGTSAIYGPVETPSYEGHFVSAADMSVILYATPTDELWTANDLDASVPLYEHPAGASAAILIRLSKAYDVTDEVITTTFVIRDANNTLISSESSQRTWDEMWHDRKCAAQIPQMPSVPGTYHLDLYMDEMYVATVEFTII